MIELINPQDNKLNKEQTAALTDGVNWVKNWYQQRKESGNYTELSEHPEFKDVMSRAENVKIIVADDMYAAEEQALERGDIHFKDEILLLCGSQEIALDALKQSNQKRKESFKASGAVVGGVNVSRYVNEPVIILNQQVLKNLSPEEISSIIVHETTHAVEAQTSEMMLSSIHSDMSSLNDEYADSPREMYARLMQLRHHFNLPPDKECTEEDITRMREECEKRRKEFVQKNGENAEIPEYVDFMMFDRYTDTEIQMLLNYTSDNTMPGQENSEEKRALLASHMRRDFNLAEAKGRANDRAAAAQQKQAAAESEKSNKERHAVELDARLVSRLNEHQYS